MTPNRQQIQGIMDALAAKAKDGDVEAASVYLNYCGFLVEAQLGELEKMVTKANLERED